MTAAQWTDLLGFLLTSNGAAICYGAYLIFRGARQAGL
jgi:hypothetical protein